MPRLSVLVPAYNAEATVARSLRSTLRALPRDAEVVVLDDGSTDGTLGAIRSIEDPRLRVNSQLNAGVAATLGELLQSTDSELVARMDADDVVLPGRFPRQLRTIDRGKDVVFTSVLPFGRRRPGMPLAAPIPASEFGLHLLLSNPVAHPTMMARRSVIDDVGGYRSVPSEDYDLWLRMASAGARITRLSLPGLAYRMHPGQITASETWRRESWEDADTADAYAELAMRLTGSAAQRITSLTIDESLTVGEKRAAMGEFSRRFEAALAVLPARSRRSLRSRLARRQAWFEARVERAAEIS